MLKVVSMVWSHFYEKFFLFLCIYLSAHYPTFSEFVHMERWLQFYQVIIIFILEGSFIWMRFFIFFVELFIVWMFKINMHYVKEKNFFKEKDWEQICWDGNLIFDAEYGFSVLFQRSL